MVSQLNFVIKGIAMKEKTSKSLSEFTNIYGLQKTLRFELVPVGKTAENLKNSNILSHDEERNGYYAEVKRVIDKQHRDLLERVLNSVPGDTFEWFKLAEIYTDLSKCSEKKRKRGIEDETRKIAARI